MTLISLVSILAGVKSTMETVSGVIDVQGHSELSENIADHPLIQVWPGGGGMGDPSSNTATQTSFKGALRQIEHVVYVDLYAAQRKDIGQDMGSLVTYIDKIMVVLDDQTSPAFGVAGARLAHWEWNYFAEAYSGEQQVGARFALTLRTY